MIKLIKKIVTICLSVVVIALGVSLIIKSLAGLGAWDAISKAFSDIFGVKIGDVMMVFNMACIFGQIAILKKQFKLPQLMQVGVVFILSYFANFFTYNFVLTKNIQAGSFIMSVLLLVIAYIICAFGVSVVMCINYISMPLEALCLAISENTTKLGFGRIRQLVDVICIVICLVLMYLFKLENIISWGTFVGMVIFGPLLDMMMPKIQPFIDRELK